MSDTDNPEQPTVSTRRTKPTKAELRAGVEQCNGTITSLLRCLNRDTNLLHTQVRLWMAQYPEIERMYLDKQQQLTDLAEDVLMKNLQTPGRRQLKTAMFILEKVPNNRFNPDGNKEDTKNLLNTVNNLIKHALTPDAVADPED